jgi:hypothetical protein
MAEIRPFRGLVNHCSPSNAGFKRKLALDPRLKIDEKLNSSSTSLVDTPKGAPVSQLVIQVRLGFASETFSI